MYDKPQILPLPDMYGKNLIFKTGGVDGCDCKEILRLIENCEIDTTPLITHTYTLADTEADKLEPATKLKNLMNSKITEDVEFLGDYFLFFYIP